MGYILVLDSSGNWIFIACVVSRQWVDLGFFPHVAKVDRRKRLGIIVRVLDFINKSCYGVCIRANIIQRVRRLCGQRIKKRTAWEGTIRWVLERLANHLKSKGIWPVESIVADGEFAIFRRIIEDVFRTGNVYFGKERILILADVLAYVNFRMRHILKKYPNIVEM